MYLFEEDKKIKTALENMILTTQLFCLRNISPYKLHIVPRYWKEARIKDILIMHYDVFHLEIALSYILLLLIFLRCLAQWSICVLLDILQILLA